MSSMDMNSQQLPFGHPQSNWRQRPESQGQHQHRFMGDSFAEQPEQSWTYGAQRFQALEQPQHQFSSHQVQHESIAVPDSGPAGLAFASSSSDPLVGLVFENSKSPSLANILQPEDPAPQTQDEQPGSKKGRVRRPRGQVHRRINPGNWEKVKQYLKHLYLDKGHTASKIREHMKREFQFDASEQQYKNKFVEWGFSKKLPKDSIPENVLQWVVLKKDDRERAGKKTEFVYEHRNLPRDRIEQIANSGRFQRDIIALDAPTPIGLTYSTPARFETAPSPFNADTVSPHPATEMPLPPAQTFGAKPVGFPQFHMSLNGHSRAELEELIVHARELSNAGKLEEAEHMFREAFVGLEHVLSATDERTISVGYEFAEFCAENNQKDDADEILRGISENIVKVWGPQHIRSVTHFLHVTDLYHGWSRADDAMTLLLHAVNFLNEPPPNTSRVEELSDNDNSGAASRNTILSRFIPFHDNPGNKGEPRSLELRLVVANAQARAKDAEAEPVLLELVNQCERFPAQLASHNFKAYAALIRLYYDLDKIDDLRPMMKKAREFFLMTMKKRENVPTKPLVNAAITLAETFVYVRRLKTAERLFEVVEQVIPEMLNRDETDKAIDLLIEIGKLYEAQDHWKYARPRFEHALALTLASRGPESLIATRLQHALENERFPLGALPKTGLGAA